MANLLPAGNENTTAGSASRKAGSENLEAWSYFCTACAVAGFIPIAIGIRMGDF
jgi:hypothetical protein